MAKSIHAKSLLFQLFGKNVTVFSYSVISFLNKLKLLMSTVVVELLRLFRSMKRMFAQGRTLMCLFLIRNNIFLPRFIVLNFSVIPTSNCSYFVRLSTSALN